MGMQIKVLKLNHKSNQLPASKGRPTSIQVQTGDKFELLDPVTGKSPTDLLAHRVGNNLVLSSATEQLNVQMVDFFSADAAQPASITFKTPGAQSLSIIESTYAPVTAPSASSLSSVAPEAPTPSLSSSTSIQSLNSGLNFGVPNLESSLESWVSSFNAGFATVGPTLGVTAAASAGVALAIGGGSAAAGGTSTASSIVSGMVVAGIFVSQVKIELYDKNGNLLAANSSDADGNFSLNVGSYKGAVLAIVKDINDINGIENVDYLDEASGVAVDLKVNLRAVGVIGADGKLSLNITPLTELAVRQQPDLNNLTDATVIGTNKAIAKTILGLDDQDISTLAPKATNAKDGSFNTADGVNASEKYGAALASMSGIDGQTIGGMSAALDKLHSALSITNGVATLTSEGWTALREGSEMAAPKVKGNLSEVMAGLSPEVAHNLATPASIIQVSDNVGITRNLSSGSSTDDVTPTLRVSLVGTNAAAGNSVQLFGNDVLWTQVPTINELASAIDLSLAGPSSGASNVTLFGLLEPSSIAGTTAATATGPAAPSSVVSGTIISGPSTRPLSIKLYDANNHLLTFGQSDPNGSFYLNVGNYTGTVLAVAQEIVENSEYQDELQAPPLGLEPATLRAASIKLPSGALSLNINTLTELAVRQMADLADTTKVISTNKAIAQNFGLGDQDITALIPQTNHSTLNSPTVVNSGTFANGTVNANYGQILAAMSGLGGSGTSSTSLEELSQAAGLTPLSSVVLRDIDIANQYVDITPTLTNGNTYNLNVKVLYGNNKVGPTSNNFALTVDTTAPTQTATITAVTDDVGSTTGTITNGGTTDDTHLLLSGTLTAPLASGDTVRIYDGHQFLGTASINGLTWNYADSRALINTQRVSYTAKVGDAAGNEGNTSAAYTATVDTIGWLPTIAPYDGVGHYKATTGPAGMYDSRNIYSDLNNDGLSDKVVWATGGTPGSTRSYVVFGKSTGATSPIDLDPVGKGTGGFAITGPTDSTFGHYDINQMGDLNGDGVIDVTVNAWSKNTPDKESITRSYVVYGKPAGFSSGIDLVAVAHGTGGFAITVPTNSSDITGYNVNWAGDVNGDGFIDLTVNSWKNTGGPGTGYVVFGKSSGFDSGVDLNAIASGAGGFALTGMSVQGMGDLNRDGLGDLNISTWNSTGSADRTYVVEGKTSLSAAINFSAISSGTGGFVVKGQTGISVNSYYVNQTGDVNGDGLGDITVGTWKTSTNSPGPTYVIFSQPGGFSSGVDLNTIATGTGGFVITGQANNNAGGYSISSAGEVDGLINSTAKTADVNGDGVADLIVNTWGQSGGVGYSSYVIFGKDHGFGAAEVSLDLIANGTGGFSIAGPSGSGIDTRAIGDVNGDGLADLAVENRIGTTTHAYVVFGKKRAFDATLNLSTLDKADGLILNSDQNSTTSVRSAGDINGDGLADVSVSQVSLNGQVKNYVMFGSSTGMSLEGAASGLSGFEITGPSNLVRKAFVLGDVNGDGVNDLFVETGNKDTDPGYMVFGKAGGFGPAGVNLNLIAQGTGGFVITDQVEGGDDIASVSMSSIGDVDGDGIADQGIRTATLTGTAGPSLVIFSSKNDFNARFTQLGDTSDNVLTGTSQLNRMVGLAGDDTLVGSGGADILYGNTGNDTFVLNADNITRLGSASTTMIVNGGAGKDTLQISEAGSLDLTVTPRAALKGIEVIDMSNGAANILTLGVKDLLNRHDQSEQSSDVINRLLVKGDSHDTLALSTSAGGTWSTSGTEVVANVTYDVYVNSLNVIDKLLVQHGVGIGIV